MRTFLKATLLVFALSLLAGGIYVLVVLWPWLAGPGEPAEQIEKRYAALSQLADFPKDRPKHPGLKQALTLINPQEAKLIERLKKGDEDRLPIFDMEAVGPEVEAAIKHLVAWQQAKARLSDKRCPDIDNPIAMLTLGRLALATAPDDPEAPQVQAMLYLAEQCRRHGLLIHQMLGLVLAEEAIQWCRHRKLTPGPSFSKLAPKREAIFSGLVRESICMTEMAEREMSQDDKRTPNAGAPFGASLVMERELLWIKKYNADRFEALQPVRNDPKALAAGLVVPENTEDLPPSFLIRLTASHSMPALVQRMAEHIRTYEKLAQN